MDTLCASMCTYIYEYRYMYTCTYICTPYIKNVDIGVHCVRLDICVHVHTSCTPYIKTQIQEYIICA